MKSYILPFVLPQLKARRSVRWIGLPSVLLVSRLVLFGMLCSGKSITDEHPLLSCEASSTEEMGIWDEMDVVPELEGVILRRGDEIDWLSMRARSEPLKKAADPSLSDARISNAMVCGKKGWVFLTSRTHGPKILEIASGKLANLFLPGITYPDAASPEIHVEFVASHAHAAILTVQGGQPPVRNDFQPVYFWMSLDSGEMKLLPIDWKLKFASPTENVAVFETLQKSSITTPGVVKMTTGEVVAWTESHQDTPFIRLPATWDYNHCAPVVEFRRGHGDTEFFVGVSKEGVFTPFPVESNDEARNVFPVSECGGVFGLQVSHPSLNPLRSRSWDPCPFLLLDRKVQPLPQLVAGNAMSYTLFDNGNCLYATWTGKAEESFPEVIFRSRDGAAWNVLDGVDHPPIIERESSQDYPTVRCWFTPANAGGANVTLCHFYVRRKDSHDNDAFWNRTMLITSHGKRYITNLFRERASDSEIYLDNSGSLLTASRTYINLWSGWPQKITLTRYQFPIDQEAVKN